MNEEIYITTNTKETQKIAKEFAKNLQPGFIAFYGNLGSGKTTFIQGMATGLGIKRRIISPTFIIVRSYELKSKIKKHLLGKSSFPLQTRKIKSLYHVDLYRTQNIHDLLSVGLDQIIEDKTAIIALEWAEKMGEMLPKKRIELYFRHIDENKREIIIKHINS